MSGAPDTDAHITVRAVDVRTWPVRSDVLVIGRGGMALAHYRLDDLPPEPDAYLFDPTAQRTDRVRAALTDLERDQERLRREWGVGEDEVVVLREHPEPYRALRGLLAEYGLDLDAMSLSDPERIIGDLNALAVESHWELMCDWFDRAIRRQPAGSSRADEASWCVASHPDRATNLTTRAGGSLEEARELLRDEVDLPLGEFSLFELICWTYYFRTELRGMEMFPLQAIDALRA